MYYNKNKSKSYASTIQFFYALEKHCKERREEQGLERLPISLEVYAKYMKEQYIELENKERLKHLQDLIQQFPTQVAHSLSNFPLQQYYDEKKAILTQEVKQIL